MGAWTAPQSEMKLTLPAVLCIQTGIQPLRYLSAMKRQKVRSTPVKSGGRLDRESVGQAISGMMAYGVKGVELPSREGQAEMITGDRSERAKKLLEIIGKAL